MKDDFHLDTKDVEVVRKALEAQGVKDIKGVALYALPMGEARGRGMGEARGRGMGEVGEVGRRNEASRQLRCWRPGQPGSCDSQLQVGRQQHEGNAVQYTLPLVQLPHY